MAIGQKSELPALFGKRNPYLHSIGVIAPGANADMLAVTRDPLTEGRMFRITLQPV